MRLLTLALCLLAGTAAHAESYTLNLGGDVIGTLEASAGSLRSNVTDSPLGVGNGTFSASSKDVQIADGRVVRQYLSNSPAKGRTISVLHSGGVALETTVSPASDATALSEAAAVPRGVTDPVIALRRLLTDRDTCPNALRFYEGRRVITISPTGSTFADGVLSCEMRYRVTAGPGHFSPLFIKNATIETRYANGRFSGLTIASGLFSLDVLPR